jgi:murein DD-endopeptidase MepM/ murein hydrolase activator NlpD
MLPSGIPLRKTPVRPPESRGGPYPQPSGPLGCSPQASTNQSQRTSTIRQPDRMFEFLIPSVIPSFAALAAVLGSPSTSPHDHLAWPVGGNRVILQAFEPHSLYGPGHRGIDLAATSGSAIRAMADGTVTFAGMVAGRPVISISHERLGITSSMEPVTALVRAGEPVSRGQIVGQLDIGDHCPTSCLHVGMRRGERYLNPLGLLRGFPTLKPAGTRPSAYSRPL